MVEPNIPAQSGEDPNSYFVTDMKGSGDTLSTKSKPIFDAVRFYGVKIWPYLNRAFTAIFYFIVNVIRSIIKIAFDQIKNFRA